MENTDLPPKKIGRWTYLAMFILGLAIYESGMHFVIELENQKDFSSIKYNLFIAVFTAGLTISIVGLLNVYLEAEAEAAKCDATIIYNHMTAV